MLQQGEQLFKDEKFSLDSEAFGRIWTSCCAPAVSGGFALYDGYSSDLFKIGDIVCSVGSSAGISFYGDTVTYPDNSSEQVEYDILPYPVFEGGKKVAIQRGNGFCVAKSGEAEEYAASVFLKWFTAPEQNLRFVASTGYLPVTKTAFESGLRESLGTLEDAKIRDMLSAAIEMYDNYDFFVAPVFEDFDGKFCGATPRFTGSRPKLASP